MTPVWARPLEHRFARIRRGALRVTAPGYTARFTGGEPGPAAELVIHHPVALIRRLALGGALGFGEAYLAQAWDTPDLFALLEVLSLNQSEMHPRALVTPGRLFARLRHLLRPNTRNGARRNIEAHYDLGNDFYRLWLDETLTYSCAFFDGFERELATAQREKYGRALDRLDARPGQAVLEIGSGWGGCALEGILRRLDWTGITLSPSQIEVARSRLHHARGEGSARFELRDFRDVAGRFDHIVSLEMLEAVGEPLWCSYFDSVSRLLAPEGCMALQVIVIGEPHFERYRRGADFIQRYVFPGGMLPSVKVLEHKAARAGLAVNDPSFHAIDYARTLKAWDDNVTAREGSIRELGFDLRFLRLWHFYLAYCAAGFKSGRIDLLQATVRHA